MSLGGGRNENTDNAVKYAYDKNVAVIVAVRSLCNFILFKTMLRIDMKNGGSRRATTVRTRAMYHPPVQSLRTPLARPTKRTDLHRSPITDDA